ncbi:hypothetical protein MRB53_026152 [Persea americana]|uniref:Uncharacterized protein n=1 Tax=Persea americana TaxID=3435 RepID=A0ACC2LH83_PERAE|nr:hypothetical protein MRB53_026152 [Persea americana]
MLLMAHVDFKEAETEHIWFLDSGCSNHICGKRDKFIHFDSSFRESVKMGNDSSLTVQGKGRVRMDVNGIFHVITNVFFVPELKNNLLRIGQLQEKGLAVLIQQGKCKIFHPEKGLIIETEMTHNRMFVVLAHFPPPREQKCFSSLTTDQATLWHCRYGHLSWNGFKPEAVNWTVHVLNRSPTLAVKSKTPKEAWNGLKPSVEHFRVFGCISHVHIPDNKRVKLDAKSLKCVLLGVREESEAYRLFDPISKKIIVNRDVVFEEDQEWSWDDSHKQAIVADLEWKVKEEASTEEESNGDESEAVEELEENGSYNSNLFEGGTSNVEGSLPEGRTRRPPAWMRDYEAGKGLFDEEVMFKQFKKSMMAELDMIDLGKMRNFLGIEVLQKEDGIFISQRKYTQEVLERFNMGQCNSMQNPMGLGFRLTRDEGGVGVDGTLYNQMVGSLMYLTATRPDLMFVKIEEASNRIRSKKPQIAASNRVVKVLGETREVVVRSFALP